MLREDLFNLYYSHWGIALPDGFLTQFREPFDQAEGEMAQVTLVYQEARERTQAKGIGHRGCHQNASPGILGSRFWPLEPRNGHFPEFPVKLFQMRLTPPRPPGEDYFMVCVSFSAARPLDGFWTASKCFTGSWLGINRLLRSFGPARVQVRVYQGKEQIRLVLAELRRQTALHRLLTAARANN